MRILEGTERAERLRVAIVVSRYHAFVTDRLEQGAIEALRAAGVADAHVAILRVPGAFEIPLAAKRAADTGAFDAVVCLGCLIRGATPHFDYIASAVAHGLTDAAAATGVPMAFGVLTTNSAEEALERAAPGPANKGFEAARAALDMGTLLEQLRRTPAPPGIAV
ncbi:MAG: 6,7-dimethyl-8-ribityllumazine synthase [Acidobacteriota bacterium]|nr:6,7-dimethyl-8-ribityllumazine synthase [Acidobacteriota bacterium]